MSEKIKIQSLQDQLDNVQKIIDRGLLITFILGGFGTGMLSIFFLFSSVNVWVGCAIFGLFLGLCAVYRIRAKETYKKLRDQCNQL
jgi:hypothetical protein